MLREALGRREQRGAVAGDDRRGVGGGEPGVRAVDPPGELREAGRGGRRVAEPAERMQRPDGVGVLPARPRRVGGVPGERPRARELAGRRGAPGTRQRELDREALVPERRPVRLGDRGARRGGVARLGRGLGDAGEREGEHADGVAVAQQRGALAAEAQRRRDPAAGEPGEAEHVRLDGDRRRRPPGAQLLVRVRGLRRGLGQPSGQAQGQRAHPEQHRLGVGQIVVAAPRDRQPLPGQRARLTGAPGREQRLHRAERDGGPHALVDRRVVEQRPGGGQRRGRAPVRRREPHPVRRELVADGRLGQLRSRRPQDGVGVGRAVERPEQVARAGHRDRGPRSVVGRVRRERAEQLLGARAVAGRGERAGQCEPGVEPRVRLHRGAREPLGERGVGHRQRRERRAREQRAVPGRARVEPPRRDAQQVAAAPCAARRDRVGQPGPERVES